ncbi:TBC1 domain family member 2B-like isoform X1 [Xenia sp. Carnegie-2017]|uniref:TBC1 domain family member 2B-like isoform X1 n=2 Tax=Xenia sp. Carnegie-2017 TaxID=2897299 RepID=UPI001F050174|nr:TBC1 domain family member 2B-like isoform X1 [Xenia sp. Carnegie-2017]
MADKSDSRDETWEELTIPPEIELGTPQNEGNLQEESINRDNNEIASKKTENNLPSKATLCGFLEKLGEKGLLRTYKRRWFVFEPRKCFLYYFKNPDDSYALGHINISDATFSMDISAGRMDQFDICTANRVFHLQAEDSQTARYWLQQLQARRLKYSRTLTAMCHTGVDTVPEPCESPGLIANVLSENIKEDDEDFQSIPAPQTVGEDAAKRSPEGIFSAMFKHRASKRYTVHEESSDTHHVQTSVRRSVSMSYDSPGAKAKNVTLKRFSVRGSSVPDDKTTTECLKCRKLKEQLKQCEEELEDTKDYAQVRQEALGSLNEFLRKTVLDKDASQGSENTTESRDQGENILYIKKLEKRLKEQNDQLSNYEKEIAMLREVIKSKDEIVIKTANQLANVSNAEIHKKKDFGNVDWNQKTRTSLEQENTSPYEERKGAFTSFGSSDDAFRLFLHHIEELDTNEDKIEKLKVALRAYIAQNNFLNSEVVELTKLRKNDTERIRSYIAKNQTQEANLCRIKSKFYFLVEQVNTPVKDGKTTAISEEVMSQLLEEAIQFETEGKKNDEGSAGYDRYGFYTTLSQGDNDGLISVADKLNRQACAVEDDLRKKSLAVKWENFMIANRNKDFQKTSELKTLIRAGIPHDLRAKVWMKCINDHVKSTKRMSGSGYYKRLLDSKKDNFCPAEKQIGLDLLRTLPNNRYYDKHNAEGIEQLRRVLLAFSLHNKEIGYCQGLNRLAAIALLYLSEEESFWALVTLVEHIMPKNYYSKTLIASQVDQRVLKDLLVEKTPKISEHLDKLKIDTSLVTFNWFLTAFVDSVPIEIVLRVWDALLYEGSKILFRFAVSIFWVNEAEILKITDNMKMFEFLRNMPSQLVDADKLSQVAFQAVNPFPMQKISLLRQHHYVIVKKELAELDRMRQEYMVSKNNDSKVTET